MAMKDVLQLQLSGQESQNGTELLNKWINTVRRKKLKCRSRSKRNLRIEAVLSYALDKAVHELYNRQVLRINRLQRRKHQFRSYWNNQMRDESGLQWNLHENNPWNGELCADLSSMNNFMMKVGEIKTFVQR